MEAKANPKWWRIRTVCAWCVKEGLEDDTPKGGEVISHGICRRHADIQRNEMRQLQFLLDDVVDKIRGPVRK